jgi:hypothetical protein
MGVLRLSRAGILNGQKYNDFLAGNAPQRTYELISTATSTGSSITFSSIPQEYKHLQLRIVASNTGGFNSLAMRFNGITTGSYDRHRLVGNGSSVLSQNQISQTSIYIGQNPVTASIFGVAITDILDYTSTSKNTTVRSFSGVRDTSSTDVRLESGLFRNTSAITSIDLFMDGTSFASARASLYGIRG